MKRLLAVLAIAALVLPHGATADASENADPPPVGEVVASGDGYVTWTPPQLAPTQLAQATYRIYGILDGQEYQLKTVGALNFAAQVDAGYESYGVQVLLGAQVSAVVYSCWWVSSNPPNAEYRC